MKNKIIALLSIILILGQVPLSAFAAGMKKTGGFYDVGTRSGVVIEPYTDKTKVNVTSQDVDGDEELEQVYAKSNRLEVSYTGATEGAYYGVILVEGSGVPTKDTKIFYINQLTAASDTVEFNVYPTLPEEQTSLSLYISSSLQDQELVQIPLNYYVETYDGIVGDVNDDGEINDRDAIYLMYHTFFPDDYPVNQDCDFNGDGEINDRDAIYLMYHTFFPDDYPLSN